MRTKEKKNLEGKSVSYENLIENLFHFPISHTHAHTHEYQR